jgi:hypothetical protein
VAKRHKVIVVPEMNQGDEDYIVIEELNTVFISQRLLQQLTKEDV